jgi:hypothetical protein
MMQGLFCRRSCTVAIVILFIGAGVIPSISGNIGTMRNAPDKVATGNGGSQVTLFDAPPEVEWDKTFGGLDYDACYSVQQTSDGGYIVAGGTYSYGFGGSDVWLIKTAANGDMQWNKTLGEEQNEACYSIQKTADGGYIVVGKTKISEPENYDVLLLKTDVYGNKVWDKTFGGASFDAGWWVQLTDDGGYIITGVTESQGAGKGDLWLIKTDFSGEFLWDKTFGGIGYEEAESVLQTTDGGFILVGLTESTSSGDQDLLLIKTDNDGNKLWDKTYGGDKDDSGFSLKETDDGEYLIVGRTKSFGAGNEDLWLIKTDSSGNLLWDKTFGGCKNDGGSRIQKTNDDGYIIVGYTESFGAGSVDFWLIKTDRDGNKLWDTTIGGRDFDVGYAVQQTTDNGYIVTGWTYSSETNADVWLVKMAAFENQRPNKPAKPSGPSKGKPETEYTFTTSTTDPNGDQVYYLWDWGDGNFSEWLGPYESGGTCEESYTWIGEDNYKIKVMAKDVNGGESDWSDPLHFSTPKNKPYIDLLLLHFLKDSPHLFPILRYFLEWGDLA